MTPEANRSETQVGSPDFVEGIHPTDGVRAFKEGDLNDVHKELLDRGVPDPDVIDPQTLEVPVDKIDLTPKRKFGKKSIAGFLAGAILGGGATAMVADRLLDSNTPDQEGTSTSAGVLENENEAPDAGENVSNGSIIENLAAPSSPEQVQYVIDNPVSVDAFPDPVDALVELGKHNNVLFLADPGTYTPEQADAMYANIFDATSPYLDESKASMEQRREIVAAQFVMYDEDLKASLALRPTVDRAVESPEGLVVNADIIYGGNVLDIFGSNPETAIDYNADFVLTNDGTNWHIYAANSNHEIGNVA